MMNEKLQALEGPMKAAVQQYTRVLLGIYRDADETCAILERVQKSILDGTYDGTLDEARAAQMHERLTNMRDRVADSFDDLFALYKDISVGIALGKFESISTIQQNFDRFSKTNELYSKEIAELREMFAANAAEVDADAEADKTDAFPPVPDLSKYDFSFRPTLNPIAADEQDVEEEDDEDDDDDDDDDDEDVFSRYHEVASICPDLVSIDGYSSVYCSVEGGRYTYFIASEEYDQSDGPSGEKLQTVENPLSFGEMILYLEEQYTSQLQPSVGYFVHCAIDECPDLPVKSYTDVEVYSDIYPQLADFYGLMTKYLIDWVNERNEVPELEDLFEAVDYFLEQVTR
jgi:hypothetical protein